MRSCGNSSKLPWTAESGRNSKVSGSARFGVLRYGDADSPREQQISQGMTERNGSGKTSLLQIIPLFFGEAPSNIVGILVMRPSASYSYRVPIVSPGFDLKVRRP